MGRRQTPLFNSFFAPVPTRREVIASDPLGAHFVWWDDLNRRHITRFKAALDSADREQDLKTFLERNPMLLVQHLGGGHGRWVIPHKRLGAEHVTDL